MPKEQPLYGPDSPNWAILNEAIRKLQEESKAKQNKRKSTKGTSHSDGPKVSKSSLP